MTGSTLEAIAKQAAACKHWRWMPGMLARFDQLSLCFRCPKRLRDVPKYLALDPEAAWPDLTDPATLGCLLALVREAWSEPGVSVWYDRRVGLWSWMADGCLHSVHRPSDEDGYDTEAEALVAALEAAQ